MCPPQIRFVFDYREDESNKLFEKQRLFPEGCWSVREGIEGETGHPIYDKVILLAQEAYVRHRPGSKGKVTKKVRERVFQEAIFNSTYFSENNISCIMERRVDAYHIAPPARPKKCKVDLFVDDRYVFELKATKCTKLNLKKARQQIGKYIKALACEGCEVERAVIVYFTPTGVEAYEVDCEVFSESDASSDEPEPSEEESLSLLSIGDAST